jgi:O-antigen/teichoic acid export membrane protein
MFGFMAVATTYIFGTLLTANGSLRELNILAATAVAINIVMNLILIPEYHAFGAAISSLVTQVYMALMQVIISIQKLRLISTYSYGIRLAGFILVLFVIGYLTDRYLDSWYLGAIVIILSSLLLMFASGMLTIRDLYRIIRFDELSAGSG